MTNNCILSIEGCNEMDLATLQHKIAESRLLTRAEALSLLSEADLLTMGKLADWPLGTQASST